MSWYTILKADIATSMRALDERVKRHWLITYTFFIVVIVSFWIGIKGIYIVQEEGFNYFGLEIDRGSFAFLIFLLILARALIYTYKRVLKSRELLALFSLPVKSDSIVIGKFLANLCHALSVVGVGIIILNVLLPFSDFHIYLPLQVIAEILLLAFIASCFGISLPILFQIKPLKRKIPFLANCAILGFASVVIRYQDAESLTPSTFYLSLLIFTSLLALIPILYLDWYLRDAWNAQSYKLQGRDILTQERLKFLDIFSPLIGKRELTIARKEMIILVRDKDVIGSFISSILLIAVLIIIYFSVGIPGNVTGDNEKYVYPLLLAMAIFFIAVLQCAFIALGSVGMEGKRLWVLKSLPVEGEVVMKGKAFSILIFALPIMICAVLPIPLLVSFPFEVTLFFIIESFVFAIAFTGIGIWAGAKLPNFDESTRGSPDLVSQFLISFLCLIVASFLGGVPASFLELDYFLGIIFSIFALLMAIVILIFGISYGGSAYQGIESDRYS